MLAFSHPLTQEVAYGSQLGEQRAKAHAAAARAMIELNPDRHDELAAMIAQHLEQGGETLEAARWNARAAHWAGYSHPRDAMRLWGQGRRSWPRSCRSPRRRAALGVFSRLLQLDYAWRLGMEAERVELADRGGPRDRHRTGDLRSLTLVKVLGSARPGLASRQRLDREARTRQSHWRIARATMPCGVAIRAAGSYCYLCAGDWDGSERLLDEALEIAGDDRGAGARHHDRLPRTPGR